MKVLVFVVLPIVVAVVVFIIGRASKRIDANTQAIAAERDRLQISNRIAFSAIRAALQDPGISASTTIALDDARQAIVNALPEGHLP